MSLAFDPTNNLHNNLTHYLNNNRKQNLSDVINNITTTHKKIKEIVVNDILHNIVNDTQK